MDDFLLDLLIFGGCIIVGISGLVLAIVTRLKIVAIAGS